MYAYSISFNGQLILCSRRLLSKEDFPGFSKGTRWLYLHCTCIAFHRANICWRHPQHSVVLSNPRDVRRRKISRRELAMMSAFMQPRWLVVLPRRMARPYFHLLQKERRVAAGHYEERPHRRLSQKNHQLTSISRQF